MKSFFDRYVGAFCALILGLCAAGASHAATVIVTGTNPSQNTDNTAIPTTGAGSLTQLRIEYGTCNGTAFGTKVSEVLRTAGAPGAAFSETLNLNPGTTCVQVKAINTYAVESDPSNVISRVIDPPKPKPPVLGTVSLAINIPLDSHDGFNRTPVFTITANGPGVLMGFAKIATPCINQEAVFTYRGQNYCRPLRNHPVSGAPNIEWIKGVDQTADVVAPGA